MGRVLHYLGQAAEEVAAAREGILKSYPWLNPSDFTLADLGNGMAEAYLFGKQVARGPLSAVLDMVMSKLYGMALAEAQKYAPPPRIPPPSNGAPPPVYNPPVSPVDVVLFDVPPPPPVSGKVVTISPPPPPPPGAAAGKGVPMWVWIVGGGAALWLFSGKRR